MPLRTLALLAGLGAFAPAATTLTLSNQTGRTLVVTRLWSPWRPEPDDPPMTIPFFRRWIRPGAEATYRLDIPGKDLDSHMVVRRLPADGVIDFEHLTIRALDPEAMPDDDLPPEPLAQPPECLAQPPECLAQPPERLAQPPEHLALPGAAPAAPPLSRL